MLAITTDGDTRLRLWLNQARSRRLTVRAGAIPLRQTTACCGTKDADANSNSDNFLAGDLG